MNAVVERPTSANVVRRELTRATKVYRPNVDIVETATELTVYADMPGVSGNDIDVDFENRVLTVRGKVAERQAPEVRYALREYGVGDFIRTFEVSEAIDSSKISAQYAHGVLTLRLPKIEAVKPRKISVQAN